MYEPDIAIDTGKARYTTENAPAVIENKLGKGCAVYLNLDMHDYGKYRLTPPKEREYRELFHQLFQEAGVEASVKVLRATDSEPAVCVEVLRYRGNGADFVALMRNLDSNSESIAEFEKSERIQIIFPQRVRIKDVRTGKDLGMSNQVTMELKPCSPIILELQD